MSVYTHTVCTPTQQLYTLVFRRILILVPLPPPPTIKLDCELSMLQTAPKIGYVRDILAITNIFILVPLTRQKFATVPLLRRDSVCAYRLAIGVSF
jgi:hypothetical protein